MNKLVLSALLCLHVSLAWSQLAAVSPQIAAAEGLFKPNLATGAPNFSIPLYNFISKGISVPITLAYVGGNGIRVNEEASSVGLGWHLDCGGFITQQIRGFDDFHPDGYYSANTKKLPCVEGYKDFAQLPTTDCAGNNAAMSDQDWAKYDLEPDLFILSLPGVHAKFFFDKARNIFTTDATNLLIGYDVSAFGINWFSVTTEQGFEYFFYATEKEAAIDPDAVGTKWENQGSTWHLSRIYFPPTNENVYFKYETSPYTPLIQHNLAQTFYSRTASSFKMVNDAGSFDRDNFTCFKNEYTSHQLTSKGQCDVAAANAYNVNKVVRTKRVPLYLKSITGSMGTLFFTLGIRDDLGGEARKVNAMAVYGNDLQGNPTVNLKRYTFQYGYFESDASNNYYAYPNETMKGKRLKLLSCTPTVGITNYPAHRFSYEEAIKLPYKTSYDIDHWGYYNYAPTNAQGTSMPHNTALVATDMVGVNRNGSGLLASAHLLKKVQLPTGGILEYEYEPATNNPENPPAGVRVARVHKYEEGSAKSTKRYLYSENPTYGLQIYYGYSMRVLVNYFWDPCNVSQYPPYYAYNQVSARSYSTCHYSVYTSSNLNAFSDLSTLASKNYTKVTELEGENGENGKTEYYYPAITYSVPYYPFVPINKNNMEGLLTKKIIYKNVNGSFKKVSLEAYEYKFAGTATPAYRLESTDETNASSNTLNTNSNGIKLGFSTKSAYLPSFVVGYRMKLNQMESVKSTVTVFDQADDSKGISTTSSSFFDAFGQVKESYSNDNPTSGLGTYTRIYRYSERNPSGGHNGLFHKPVEVVSYQYTGQQGTSSLAKKSHFSEFYVYTAPWLLWEKWESNAAVTPASSTTPTDASYRKVASNAYENGNLVQTSAVLKENLSGGYQNTFQSQSILWGYSNSLPIAQITNADLSQVAYNGFETGTLPGATGWSDFGTGMRIVRASSSQSDSAFMGSYALKLHPAPAGGTIYSPFLYITPASQNRKYKFSCWLKLGGAMTADNVSLELKCTQQTYFGAPHLPYANAYRGKHPIRTTTDWQYVETLIDLDELKAAAGTATLHLFVTVMNRDNTYPVYIDELRLHPVDAQMATTAYKPGIGKISESGALSKPIHYEYDDFNRLTYVRDFRRNILKRNQYFTK